ncbi:MAG: zinc-binding dehydrogenase [Chloroflexi bacterium]|nr:zinc-binding dehydrogenase [Chloroflexota bacterium]MCL5274295.1 zinc-binding dehydrogenase [Chloroflexota bacterium]
MKAVRLIEPQRPLQMQEIPVPEIGVNDVLVRVQAAGICHSDAHYRAGTSRVEPLPMTLGHEVAGVIETAGDGVTHLKPDDRVCLHYMITCGHCVYCNAGQEQFCTGGAMIGKHRDGGYAEYIAVPARSVFNLPAGISFDAGAVMMCSSATAFHALRKARLAAGDTVAVFGVGGLGMSAVQLAFALGAACVYAVDINPARLALAQKYGAQPIDATFEDAAIQVRRRTWGRGVDVAVELIGLPQTMRQAVQSLAIQGRAALAGITQKSFDVRPYDELINREAEIIGVSDHLAQELPMLLELAKLGRLDLSQVVTRSIPLAADAINAALDNLDQFGEGVRVVIHP